MTFQVKFGSLQQQADFRAMEISTLDALRILLDHVGSEVLDYLRKLTNEWRPPTTASGSSRRAHPGHWADVTGDLAASYGYHLLEDAGSVSLVLTNTSDHAIYVEHMDGFWVLSGVTEKDGPVVQAIRDLLPRYIPGAQFRVG